MTKNILTISDLAVAKECLFFDAAQDGPLNSASWFFKEPEEVIEAWDLKDILPALQRMESLSGRYWLAGYLRYEAAAAFFPKRAGLNQMRKGSTGPLLRFGAYTRPMAVEAFDPTGAYAPLRSLKPDLPRSDYARKFRAIKEELACGNSYQVNFTFDFLLEAGASPEFLYAYLRGHQRTPYAAFIKNSVDCVLSFSPELFFHRSGSRIWARPMKGTVSRGIDDEDDAAKKEELRRDAKNRAENLMIVDLLRNDLGRIACPGTVRVPAMFDVETHPTLHQMTSLIEADLPAGTGYADIFQALFPCGSVTGAPKMRTMEIIDHMERGSRGIYCGAIGYISPDHKAVFSVPIRILQRNVSAGAWQYRAGSGIVWDSRVEDEWREAALKASFLMRGEPPDVGLVETMLLENDAITYEHEHIQRMRQSAAEFNVAFNTFDFERVMTEVRQSAPAGKASIIRLVLKASGRFFYELIPVGDGNFKGKVPVSISENILDKNNRWLRYKTDFRPWYTGTMEKIRAGKVWDELFFNAQGELCEGARSNIFVFKKGRLYTPAVSCGLLPGIFREHLLASGQCEEAVLKLEDLQTAEAVYCGNSVRGLVTVAVKGL